VVATSERIMLTSTEEMGAQLGEGMGDFQLRRSTIWLFNQIMSYLNCVEKSPFAVVKVFFISDISCVRYNIW